MIDLKELKNLIGKEICILPVQMSNANRRGVPLRKQLSKNIVEKVTSKKVTVSTIGAINIDGSFDNANFAYNIFSTEKDALDYLEKKEFLSDIKMKDLSYLSVESIKKIKSIIEGESQLDMP